MTEQDKDLGQKANEVNEVEIKDVPKNPAYGDPLDMISGPSPLGRISTKKDPQDRYSTNQDPLDRISGGDPLDRIRIGFRRGYRRR